MNINDDKYAKLVELGFLVDETLNDGDLAFLKDLDAIVKNIADGEKARWLAEGYSGNIIDARAAYLRANGFTGSINDMMSASISADGFYSPAITPVTWDPTTDSFDGIVTATYTLSDKQVLIGAGSNPGGSQGGSVKTTLARDTGLYYFEVVVTAGTLSSNSQAIGIVNNAATMQGRLDDFGAQTTVTYHPNGQVFKDGVGTFVSNNTTWTNNDVIGVAVNFSTKTVAFRKNNTAITSTTWSTFTSVSPFVSTRNVTQVTFLLKTSASELTYTPPSGYTAWES